MPGELSNVQVAATFERLADLLEIRGETVYKVAAYRKAAESIRNLPESLADVRERGELEKVPGVGRAIAQKIDDLYETGSFKLLDEVQAEYPPTVAELLTVPDVGPKRARQMYKELGIDSLVALRQAVEDGSIRRLSGLGQKGLERIVAGLASMRPPDERVPLGSAREAGLELISALRDSAPGLEEVEFAGSVRRFEETIGDLDLVAASEDPEAVVRAFVSLPQVARTEMRGPNRCRVLLRSNVAADLWVLPRRHWGSLLCHVTGNKYHDIRLRDLALARGASMSEYGFRRGDRLVACATEEEVYGFLGMQPIPPTMRSGGDEIDLALRHKLPRVVEVSDLRGDLHVHSDWSDGKRTIREMALAARDRGYEYVCITDHSQSLGVANGLTPERLARQREEIDELNRELAPFRVLQGVELEVRGDGRLDLPDDVLERLHLVVASVHSGLRQGRERVTARALSAIRHPLVDVLAHPTGRIVGGRAGGDFDLEALYREAAKTGTALEINGDPARLDLRDAHARRALEVGCTLSLDSDAHSVEGLDNVVYATAIAQRAWTAPDRVLNTLPLQGLLARRKRSRR